MSKTIWIVMLGSFIGGAISWLHGFACGSTDGYDECVASAVSDCRYVAVTSRDTPDALLAVMSDRQVTAEVECSLWREGIREFTWPDPGRRITYNLSIGPDNPAMIRLPPAPTSYWIRCSAAIRGGDNTAAVSVRVLGQRPTGSVGDDYNPVCTGDCMLPR